MEIHSLQELDQALRNGMVLAIDDGTVTSKVDVTTIEKHAIETYAGSTLAGAAQSVQAAIGKLAPQTKTAITDLSTINPGEQGYFQFTADVSPTGEQAYFTVWCTGNNERRGLITIYTASAVTRIFANSGHAQSGTVYWRGWYELAKLSDTYTVGFDSMTRLAMNDDLNTYTKAGNYIATSTGISSTLLNSPISDSGFSLHVESVAGGTGQYIVQTAKRVRGGVNVAQVFTRIYTGSAWGAWVENPSRAEIDALSSNTYEELASDATSGTVTISRYGKIRILTFTDVVASSNAINLSSALAETDRPRRLTGSTLFSATDGSVARVWVRQAGTIGTANVISGNSYNGELVYIVA